MEPSKCYLRIKLETFSERIIKGHYSNSAKNHFEPLKESDGFERQKSDEPYSRYQSSGWRPKSPDFGWMRDNFGHPKRNVLQLQALELKSTRQNELIGPEVLRMDEDKTVLMTLYLMCLRFYDFIFPCNKLRAGGEDRYLPSASMAPRKSKKEQQQKLRLQSCNPEANLETSALNQKS